MADVTYDVKTNRILSLSGGGIKGIAELKVLIEIEEKTGKSISELFPIISGTSVGGLIAALLTIPKEPGSKEAKYSAKEALEIFKESSGDIFPNVFLGSVKQIFTHKYSQKPLEELLEKYLADNRMDSPTSRLIIPVNSLTTNGSELEIFDSLDKYSPHVRVKDVLLATTAAPTYFSPIMDKAAVQGYNYASGLPYAYVDGGLDANRPANEILKILKKGHSRTEQKEILDNTMVCSLNFHNDIEPTNAIPKVGWDGILGWLTKGKLIDRLMGNKEASSSAEVKSDLPGEDEFFEIKLPITKETASLDDASPQNIQKLEGIGRKYVEDNKELIQKLCDNLLNNLTKEQAIIQNQDVDEGFESDSDVEYEREDLLTGIKIFLNEFSEKNPDLKKDIDQFLQKAENYTLEEIKECIISFEQAGLKLQEEQNKKIIPTSCAMEALKEDMDLEGLDDDHGYNDEIMA